MIRKCFICKKISGEATFGTFCCAVCKPIRAIVSTSAEDGVKYGIPGASLETLQAAKKFEQRNSSRATVLTALHRAIRKLERAN